MAEKKKKNRIKKKSGGLPISKKSHRKKHGATFVTLAKRKKSAPKFSGSGKTYECIYSGTGSAFGFAKPVSENYAGEDFFIPPKLTGGAVNGDEVLVRQLLPGEYGFGKGNEGAVIEITKRRITDILGVLRSIGDVLYVIPDDRKDGKAIEVTGSNFKVSEGDKVRLKITIFPDEYRRLPHVRRKFEKSGELIEAYCGGEIIASYGPADTKSANYKAILDMAGIPQIFPKEALDEANSAAEAPLNNEGRLDLRDQIIFTIDGEDAKDLDDAISISRSGDEYLLGVHIADVSHYVSAGGAVDREAMSRGTSVYFVDKVVPMLPEILSNGCCSLNAGEDKYALSAVMQIDSHGEIVSSRFSKSIIRSVVRGVYSEVNDILGNGITSAYAEKYKVVIPSLEIMAELYHILDKRSRERGALDLDGDEAVILLDKDGMPESIMPRSRGMAERLIEQFMLRANVAAASFLKNSGRSGVYRIHEEPAAEKMQSFAIFAHNMGLDVGGICRLCGESAEVYNKITPSALSEILEQAKEKGIGEAVSGVLLRSLMKARYSPAPSMHFGLAEELYCHFTSPIRRYPDLFVHRAISSAISGGPDIKGSAEAAERSSDTEIRAVDAERRIEALYMALYMKQRIGEILDAVIVSVTSFGIFARTDNMCEGLIPLSEFGNNVSFNEKMMSLTVKAGSFAHTYRLGDKLQIAVTAADIAVGKVTFGLADKKI